MDECRQACAVPPPTPGNDVPSQAWINKNIFPDEPSGIPTTNVVYDKSNGMLCKISSKDGSEVSCQPNICSYGQVFKNDGFGVNERCEDLPCKPGCKNCIRGMCLDNIPKGVSTMTPKFILTNYALPSNSILSKSADALGVYIKDMVENFCVPNGVDVFSLYVIPQMNIKWLYDIFIKVCNDNGVEAAINVYPNYKDGPWNGSKSWSTIGDYVGRVNKYAEQQGGSGFKMMIFDKEGCACGNVGGDTDTVVRTPFAGAYQKSNGKTLSNDFIIMASQNVGFAMSGSGITSSGYPNNIGLGEVYWNINELFPCFGNEYQYNNYMPVCKANSNGGIGSSYHSFRDNPEGLVDFLEAASKQQYSGGVISNIYDPTKAKKDLRTLPLFSTEALYSQPNGTSKPCAALAYFGTQSVPSASDKICGTFDGFGTWEWPNFKTFMTAFAQRYNLPYIGIYDAMFIPANWMKGGKFNNTGLMPNLPAKWPVICTDPANKCNEQCIVEQSVKCKVDSDCGPPIKKYISKNGCTLKAPAYWCKDNKTCQYQFYNNQQS